MLHNIKSQFYIVRFSFISKRTDVDVWTVWTVVAVGAEVVVGAVVTVPGVAVEVVIVGATVCSSTYK